MKAIWVVLGLLLVNTAFAHGDIKEISWATQEWKSFTDKDGSGIYSRVINSVFNHSNVKVNVKYMPFERSIRLLKNSQVDFAGALPLDASPNKKYIQSEYPIVSGVKTNVMFLKRTIPNWQGKVSLRGKRVGGTHSFSEFVAGQQARVFDIPKREQIMKMLLRGRLDFYIDDEHDMQLLIENFSKELEGISYEIQTVNQIQWYMNAPNTPRGKAVMTMYNENFKSLYQSGELAKIYRDTEFDLPLISATSKSAE
ncbi:MAG: substrate-binding periplasmic protein [Psychrobium sp.]